MARRARTRSPETRERLRKRAFEQHRERQLDTGTPLRRLRVSTGLTLPEAASLAGIHAATWWFAENEPDRLRASTWRKIATAFERLPHDE